jgi:hypothetical protein
LRLRYGKRERIREHFSEKHVPGSHSGHKLIPARVALEAVLWVRNIGAPRHMFPQC